ncbi:MAG: hypothetical protein HRU07_00115 [Nitrosopumilus sp.]|nr:hypothetical protein [Nitrosopumilus sp.]NRA04585.1 hypothetical protein [Nitrosopumilus sp.]
MSQVLKPKLKEFLITYDGQEPQVLVVTHQLFYSNKEFQQFIIHQKCLDCDFESHFEKV